MMLEVQELSKTFPSRGEIKGFRKVSFSLAEGEAIGLVGESGCGKTTLVRTILRLIPPDDGRIYFQGEPWLELWGRNLRERRRGMQAVFQDPESSLNPRMTNLAIVEEPLKVHHMGDRAERRSRVDELLSEVGLPLEIKHHRPGRLSGGQKQRLAIARALATRPSLLIADEPLSALDLSIQLQVLGLLKKLKGDHELSILFISHSVGAARHLCDRIAVMRSGRFVEFAPARTLLSKPTHPYTEFLLRSQEVESFPPAEASADDDFSVWTEIEPEHWVLAKP